MSEKLNRTFRSIAGMKLWVKIWLMLLGPANMLAFLYLDTDIGYWTAVAGGLVVATNIPMMFAMGGVTRALSLPHMIWVPLLIYIFPRIIGPEALDPGSAEFRLGVTIFVFNSISLAFDFLESYRWFNGEREILGLDA